MLYLSALIQFRERIMVFYSFFEPLVGRVLLG